jgi:energy-coupling factor transport system ATP-binding protein
LWSNSAFDIEFRDLTVRYPDRTTDALSLVNERVSERDVVAIAGPSGCGKTTLCLALTGFIPRMIPARLSGDVFLGGRSTREAAPEELATSIGLVQQDPEAQICTLNVAQEAAFGPENLSLPSEEVERRVTGALDCMGLTHLRERRTTTLSGGEKQRLAIAAILTMEPRVLLLDEPTANLDPRGVRDLFALLSRGERERSLVIVEHRIDALRALAPRLILLDHGRIVDRYPAREHLDYAALGLRGAWPTSVGRDSAGAPLLDVRGVTFGYGEPLLRELEFSLHAGEVLGIIGPNGGGKTTLLRLLARLEKPESGGVAGVPTTGIGFVFQHPHHQIFERTVRREMELEHPGPAEAIDAGLRAAQLAELHAAAPLSLSLGEQRRLTVATTLARRPRVLLLDEPFIGQDRRNVLWMIDQIRAVIGGGGAVVLVTHDIPLVNALADRLLYLERDVAWLGPSGDVFDRLRQRGDVEFTPEAWS